MPGGPHSKVAASGSPAGWLRLGLDVRVPSLCQGSLGLGKGAALAPPHLHPLHFVLGTGGAPALTPGTSVNLGLRPREPGASRPASAEPGESRSPASLLAGSWPRGATPSAVPVLCAPPSPSSGLFPWTSLFWARGSRLAHTSALAGCSPTRCEPGLAGAGPHLVGPRCPWLRAPGSVTLLAVTLCPLWAGIKLSVPPPSPDHPTALTGTRVPWHG